MKKRVLPLFLTLALCLSLFVLPAAAAPEEFVIEDGVLYEYNGPGGKVVIPEGVTSISFHAFYDADVTQVVFPESLRSIDSGAFSHCTNLEEITIPGGVEEIGGSAFQNCVSLRRATLGEGVHTLGSSAFCGCVSLTQADLPESLRSIQDTAFQDCISLTSITIPEGVTEIGNRAFDSCIRLEEVQLPSTLESLAVEAFRNTPWLKQQGGFLILNGCLLSYSGKGGDVVIPDGVTSIAMDAFIMNQDVTSITIPGSVKAVSKYAFVECTNLRRVVLKDGVEEIEEFAFSGCFDLREVVIPDSVTSISGDAFMGTPWLEEQEGMVIVNDILLAYRGEDESLIIPDGVKEIASWAFYENETLTSVTIPESVQRIGAVALTNTPWEQAQGDFPTVNGILISYHGNDSILTVPSGIQRIGDSAFAGNVNIASATIPGSVKVIDKRAFKNCDGLSAAILQEGVERIEALAFSDCDYLSAIYLPASLSYIAKDAFYPIDLEQIVFCAPAGSYAETWLTGKGLQVSPPDTPVSVFTDITGYYTVPALWAAHNGITKGTSPTTFSPERICTREEVITMLWRAAGSPEAEEAIPFTDVSPADYSYPAICWAYANEIAGGTDDTHFSPKAPCTRAQAVHFLGNELCEYSWKDWESEWMYLPFEDVPSTADYAWAVYWAVMYSITTGTSETTFSPDLPCTRGQIVTFLYRAEES